MWRIHIDPLAVGLHRPTNNASTSTASASVSENTNPTPINPPISTTTAASSSGATSSATSTSATPSPDYTPSAPASKAPATTTTSTPEPAKPTPKPPQRSAYPPLSASDPPSLAHAMQMLAVNPNVFKPSAKAKEPASSPVRETRSSSSSLEHRSRQRRRERAGRSDRERDRERGERRERKERRSERVVVVEGAVHSESPKESHKEKEKERGGVKNPSSGAVPQRTHLALTTWRPCHMALTARSMRCEPHGYIPRTSHTPHFRRGFFKDVLSFGQSSSAPIIKTTKTVVQTVTTHHDSYTTTSYDSKTEHSTPRDAPRYAIQPLVCGVFTPQLPNEIWLVILKYAAAPPFVPIPTSTSADPISKSGRTEFTVPNPYPYSYPYPAALDATQLASPSCPSSSSESFAAAAWDDANDSVPAVSFISAPPAHTQRNVRRAQYLAQWRARVALTSVCRVWWSVGQEVLWQAVWVGGAREGRKLAGRLCGDSEGAELGGAVVSVGTTNAKKKEKAKDSKGKGKSKLLKSSTSTLLSPAARMERSWSDIGRFILHLHIETPAMDRCSPHDLLIILAKCPRLQVFADYNSVRRPMHPLVMGSNEVVPWKASSSGGSGSRFGTVTRVWAGPSATKTAKVVDASTSDSSDGTDSDDEYYDSGDGDSDEEFKHPFTPRPSHSSLRPPPCPDPAPVPTRSAHVHGFTSSFVASSSTTFHRSSSGDGYGASGMGPADALLQTILSKPLKRLTYTNYDHDGGADVRGGVKYYREVVEPRLRLVGGGLEYLEVVLSARAVDMGGREERAWAWGVDSGSGSASGSAFGGRGSGIESVGGSGSNRASGSGILRNPAVGVYGAANMLTELEAQFTTTTTTACTDPMASTATSIGVISGLVSGDIDVLSLPSLRSLKATLDQATFKVLATWDMPVLTHLSVVAADFGYTGRGFRKFFQVHGDKLIQLELGHSSGEIEQYWLTEPPRRAGEDDSDDEDVDLVVDGNGHRRPRVMLDAWCPNLKEFICSADAEWSWETPDWIAPHVLLPAHSSLEFIGVRDMSARLRSDMEEHCRRHREPVPVQLEGYVFASAEDVQSDGEDALWDGNDEPQAQPGTVDPYFMLMQQFGSLLREESFPRLRYLRDLSWESDVIRRTGRMGSGDILLDATFKPTPLGPVTIISAGNLPPASTASGPGQPKWWSPHAYTPGKVADKKTEDAAKTEEAAKAALEEAFARSHGAAVLRFWDAVIIMCKHRGVWLEDCRGVNITRNDISRAAELSAY
ncbi:hypothetical protein D9619_003833 [Psilocybe cf. subviscida]|uniref:Uncharacterized protein n=1 Tax=Psilocybe cf. subviscida TaxID=2480587 RepID=A0A8H5EUV7_9AGAR|nr:hypothetical protein D9619_003833 [Psilocybe cf. subviscida]